MPLLHIRESAFPGVRLSSSARDDEPLVKASQQGDQEAFALLVRGHQCCIFNLSLDLLQDEHDASESTQEAFVAVWQGLPGFRGEVDFSTWLYRHAYRRCLRWLERRTCEDAPRSVGQTEQALVREQLVHLPLTSRAVLILHHLHGKTYEEMAYILSLSVGTVKSRLFRARTLLPEGAQAQSLVARETVVGTSLTENENSMQTSGRFHGRGQNSSDVNQETDDFSQQQHAWAEQQQHWLEQQHSALTQQEAWLQQRRGWLEQQQGWLEQRRAWLAERRSWLSQQRAWKTHQDDHRTQQQEAWLAQQEAWLNHQYIALVQQVSDLLQHSQWMSQQRSWLTRQQHQFPHQESMLTGEDDAEERRSG